MDHSNLPITPRVKNDDKLQKYLDDLSKDANIINDQRYAANEDMRFINVDGGMWEGDFEDLGNRVKLELDMCSDYVQRFIGEWNQNRVGVEFKPDDDKTNDDDAELINGIYRADFRQNKGKLSTDQAVDEVATCGYGAMKLATFFVDEEDPGNFDKRIEWRPIYNAYNTVIWDQAAKRIDKSDARWCNELTGFTKDAFEEAYPDKMASSAYSPEEFFSNQSLNHVTFIYIATRYEIVRRRRNVFVYDNLVTGEREVYESKDHTEIEDVLKKDDKYIFVGERRIIIQSIEKTVFSGDDILEKTRRISGKWIPIIPFYGYRAYVDNVETYRGLVRKLKDACRLFNMQVSQFAENAASSGQEIPLFDPEQMQGNDIQDLWADRNNKAWLPVRTLYDDSTGAVIAKGPQGYLKPAQLDGSTIALSQIVPEYIQRVTGGVAQDVMNPDASGKAIRAMMKRENMTTQVVNDNISNAIAWSGTVYQSMAAEEYNTQRRMKILGKDGTEGEKLLLQTTMSPQGIPIEVNTLQGKKFHAYSDTGPQYESMREETVEDLKGMLVTLGESQAGQQYVPLVLSAIIENISGVGLDALKEFNRNVMIKNGSIEPDTEKEQQMLAQFQQQAQQPDAQQQLLKSASNQQEAEARSLDASSVQKIADAGKKEAETLKLQADIGAQSAELVLKAQKQLDEQQDRTIELVENLPLQ